MERDGSTVGHIARGSSTAKNTREIGVETGIAAPVNDMPWVCFLLFYVFVVGSVKIIGIHLKPFK